MAQAKGIAAKPAAQVAPQQVVYVVNSKKPYSPRPNTAQGNVTTWAAVTAAINSNGAQTALQLQAVAKQFNHTPFIGYCIKRGWLVAK